MSECEHGEDKIGARETLHHGRAFREERKAEVEEKLQGKGSTPITRALLFMKVRAAAWHQGWGKGQTCEQMDGENVSSSCYRRQKLEERRSRDDGRVWRTLNTASTFATSFSRGSASFLWRMVARMTPGCRWSKGSCRLGGEANTQGITIFGIVKPHGHRGESSS